MSPAVPRMSLLEFTKIIIENENVLFHMRKNFEQAFVLEFNKGVCRYIHTYPYTYGHICQQYNYYQFLINCRFIVSKLNDQEYVINYHEYTFLDFAAKIIWRYWRKYRYNIFKKHRDPLKRELMAYCWNPSRRKFDL